MTLLTNFKIRKPALATLVAADLTTARDLAALARVALDEPLFARIVSRTTWTTTTWRRDSVVLDLSLTTTNQLLRNTRPEFYPGASCSRSMSSGCARSATEVSETRWPKIPPCNRRL